MPKMISFLYCESAQNEMTPAGPKLHLISPLLKFSPMFIPSMFSFSILVTIGDFDVESTHTLRFLLKEPETGVNIIDTGDAIIPIQNDLDLTEDFHSIMLSMDFRNIPLKYEGMYKGEVYFDGVLLEVYPIKAKAVEMV